MPFDNDNSKKDELIGFKVTNTMKKWLRALAKEQNLKLSEYMVQVCEGVLRGNNNYLAEERKAYVIGQQTIDQLMAKNEQQYLLDVANSEFVKKLISDSERYFVVKGHPDIAKLEVFLKMSIDEIGLHKLSIDECKNIIIEHYAKKQKGEVV